MRPTRRFWAFAATAALLAALGVAYGRPLLFVGAAGVGGFLLVRQYLFVRRLRRTVHALTVDLSVPSEHVSENESSLATLSASIETGSPLSLAVTAETPVSASGPPPAGRRVELTPGTESATTTFEVAWSIVGTVAFDPPSVAVRDAAGLFRERFRLGRAPRVTVQPRRPRRLHVGEGGDRVGFGFGEHRAGRLGSGIDPAELRRYVPGDDASDIDWNATARLDEAYVREHEVQTDRETVVLFDHRRRLDRGPPGETQLDYLRAVALTFVDQARSLWDPLGLYTVGDDGLTFDRDPGTDEERYLSISTALSDVGPDHGGDPDPDPGPGAGPDGDPEPVDSGPDSSRGPDSASGRSGTSGTRERSGRERSPATARRLVARLDGEAPEFDRTLRPYLRDANTYVRRIEGDPLFGVARSRLSRLGDGTWVLVFTDDADRSELWETVKVLRSSGASHVSVFLAPTVFYDQGGLADLDDAYERYADFESFRRDLARLDRVSAYEVGPEDRIDAVLSATRRAR